MDFELILTYLKTLYELMDIQRMSKLVKMSKLFELRVVDKEISDAFFKLPNNLQEWLKQKNNEIIRSMDCDHYFRGYLNYLDEKTLVKVEEDLAVSSVNAQIEKHTKIKSELQDFYIENVDFISDQNLSDYNVDFSKLLFSSLSDNENVTMTLFFENHIFTDKLKLTLGEMIEVFVEWRDLFNKLYSIEKLNMRCISFPSQLSKIETQDHILYTPRYVEIIPFELFELKGKKLSVNPDNKSVLICEHEISGKQFLVEHILNYKKIDKCECCDQLFHSTDYFLFDKTISSKDKTFIDVKNESYSILIKSIGIYNQLSTKWDFSGPLFIDGKIIHDETEISSNWLHRNSIINDSIDTQKCNISVYINKNLPFVKKANVDNNNAEVHISIENNDFHNPLGIKIFAISTNEVMFSSGPIIDVPIKGYKVFSNEIFRRKVNYEYILYDQSNNQIISTGEINRIGVTDHVFSKFNIAIENLFTKFPRHNSFNSQNSRDLFEKITSLGLSSEPISTLTNNILDPQSFSNPMIRLTCLGEITINFTERILGNICMKHNLNGGTLGGKYSDLMNYGGSDKDLINFRDSHQKYRSILYNTNSYGSIFDALEKLDNHKKNQIKTKITANPSNQLKIEEEEIRANNWALMLYLRNSFYHPNQNLNYENAVFYHDQYVWLKSSYIIFWCLFDLVKFNLLNYISI
ncbi:MAG: hypothetical protein INQ03_08930 [Candidatus Heimdallarchaeota archaeon]|nr:hypothetical protein [Candidatus Heimdallarchaeota archaeon]